MTPREADRIIRAGAPVQLRDRFGDTFIATITHRDRWNVYTADGGKFDRGDLQLGADATLAAMDAGGR